MASFIVTGVRPDNGGVIRLAASTEAEANAHATWLESRGIVATITTL